MEITTKVTYKYLMGKSKHDLVYMVLDLLDELEKYRDESKRYWDLARAESKTVFDEVGMSMDLEEWNKMKERLIDGKWNENSDNNSIPE